MIKIIDNLLS